MSVLEFIAPFLAVAAAMAVVLIGLIVWFGDRRNRSRIVFLWLAVFVSLWIMSNVVFVVATDADRFIVALVSYGAAMLVAVQTLVFIWGFIQKKFNSYVVIAVVIGYIIAVLSAVPGIVGVGIDGLNIITHIEWLTAYGVILIGYLLTACILLLSAYSRANRVLRRHVRIILYGIIIASVVGVCCNLLLPLAGNYRLTQLGPAGAVVFVGAIAYSIARYRLFDVRLAIVRAAAYLATFATLAGLYFGIVFAAALALDNPLLSANQMVANIIVAFLMALLLQPIKRFFDKLTNAVFYKDNYNNDELFARLNRTLSSTTNDLRSLLQQAAQEISTTLKAEHAFFFVYTDGDHYLTAGTGHHIHLPLADARTIDAYVRSRDLSLVTRHLLDANDDIIRLLVSYKVALLLPLRRGGDIVGYFCLGEQRSGGYTRRDMKVLLTLADGLMIAIQNALSVQQVKELNATLQQRVDNATKELRASNAQLRRLDEAKDEFVSMASHQLRTPLTSVKGYISMVLEGDAGKISDMQTHLLSEAFTSSERMVHLINDFLNVSRLQTGKFIIDKRPVNLANIVRQELDGLRTSATARGLKFSYKSPKNFPILNLDEGKIRQVIMNFADNALYYSREKTTTAVTLSIDGDTVIFTVEDTGIGVPKAEQTQLFSKFYRASNARKQRPDGTGVGLFLAKKVIDAHGGAVIFESAEGKGSTFGFRLPLTKLRAVDDSDKLDNQPNDK